MRESFSETWTIQQVAFFTILMIAFLCAMVSYAKCFRVKNETISIIEKYGTYSNKSGSNSQTVINNYLKSSGYEGTGRCPIDFITVAPTGYNYKYCVKKHIIEDDYNYIRYEVIVFYTFKVPAAGNIVSFKVSGKTHELKVKDVDTSIFP